MATGQLLCSFMFDSSITSVVMDSGEYRLMAGAANGNIYQVNLLEMVSHFCLHENDF